MLLATFQVKLASRPENRQQVGLLQSNGNVSWPSLDQQSQLHPANNPEVSALAGMLI